MLLITIPDINRILEAYGTAPATSFEELQRYNYEDEGESSRHIRLILKAMLADGSAVVIRLKNESDVTLEMIEQQCRFASLLYENGIPTPRQYSFKGSFASLYTINGYELIVCVEDFAEGSITEVNAETAEKTGALLARTHNTAERFNAHVEADVLFDPFKPNDLFTVPEFDKVIPPEDAELREVSQKIMSLYNEYMEKLSSLKAEPSYAVQGDISDCNLYRTKDGGIGLYDFNNSGDCNLFCDAFMQAVFEARLMDYPEECRQNSEQIILPAFLKGYNSERPFSALQKRLMPYLYAIIDAFWNEYTYTLWWEDYLEGKEAKSQNPAQIKSCLYGILERISALKPLVF